MDLKQFVKFINAELQKNKTISVNKLCDKLYIKKSTLKSKMSRGNYSYNAELRQYIKDNTTSNSSEILQKVVVTKKDITSNITGLENLDIDKLNLLLTNLDVLLELVNKKHNTSNITVNSNKTRVTSLRINEEVYNMIKDRAVRDNTSISDIVNRSLIEYLNNYI